MQEGIKKVLKIRGLEPVQANPLLAENLHTKASNFTTMHFPRQDDMVKVRHAITFERKAQNIPPPKKKTKKKNTHTHKTHTQKRRQTKKKQANKKGTVLM